MRKLIQIILFITITPLAFSQSVITNEDIWSNFKYITKSISSFNFSNDGKHYYSLEENQILRNDLVTGKVADTLVDARAFQGLSNFTGNISDFEFDDSESKVLVASEKERKFRRSFAARYHLIDLKSKNVLPIFDEGKILHTTQSPNSNKIAFVFDNNLYYRDFSNGSLTQITFDGELNHIINGAADWVYQEEFNLTKAFEWSNDGKQIAYLKFNESNVKSVNLTNYEGRKYPSIESYKFPKTGEEISKVTVHVYDTSTGKTRNIDLGIVEDYYIPSIQWTKNQDQLCLMLLNRPQNRLQLVLANLNDSNFKVIANESSDSYIDILDPPIFLNSGDEFIWTSESSGFKHLYLCKMDGTKIKDLTPGNFDVDKCYGLDEKRNILYYQASKSNAWDKQVYSVNLAGKYDTKLSKKQGFNNLQFNSSFEYYILKHSTINSPPSYKLYDRLGRHIRDLEINAELLEFQYIQNVRPINFFKFNHGDSLQLSGWMVTPELSSESKFPVLMYVYGGPGSQEVVDVWKDELYWWFQLLVKEGYIVLCVDGRGTGGKGKNFKKATYGSLGYYEAIDQIAATKYLATLGFIDMDRIGIYGWSYGGYLATHCLLRSEGVFKMGIAVAPVTDWTWYNTVFSEKYMGSIEENTRGYNNSSLINYSHLLQGDYLLVHGLSDDNVHFQHTAELTNALIRANKQFETYIYPNRNHGIYGSNARLHLFTKMTNFIKAKL